MNYIILLVLPVESVSLGLNILTKAKTADTLCCALVTQPPVLLLVLALFGGLLDISNTNRYRRLARDINCKYL